MHPEKPNSKPQSIWDKSVAASTPRGWENFGKNSELQMGSMRGNRHSPPLANPQNHRMQQLYNQPHHWADSTHKPKAPEGLSLARAISPQGLPSFRWGAKGLGRMRDSPAVTQVVKSSVRMDTRAKHPHPHLQPQRAKAFEDMAQVHSSVSTSHTAQVRKKVSAHSFPCSTQFPVPGSSPCSSHVQEFSNHLCHPNSSECQMLNAPFLCSQNSLSATILNYIMLY